MPAAGAELPPLSLFPDSPGNISLSLPVLGGQPREAVFSEVAASGESGVFALFRSGAWLLGIASQTMPHDLEANTCRFYQELFQAAHGYHLCRIWNYVPQINALNKEGLENYRAFSSGRSQAFEQHFGRDFKCQLPSASAVGTDGSRLTVLFAASPHTPHHCENPSQVPAYDYPAKHGPRPPSFSRATVVPAGQGRADVFISGTAAIKGHETIAPGDTGAQLDCTLENLRRISCVAGLGDTLGAGQCAARHFKIYLRHAEDYCAVAAALEQRLLRPGDVASYLRADICRAELNVEIEATVLGSSLGSKHHTPQPI